MVHRKVLTVPIIVPRSGNANMPIPVPSAKPSETDMMMALATMHSLGRIPAPTFDERFRGQDPASLPIDVSAKGGPVRGIGKEELRGLKQEWINKGTADQGREADLPGTDDPMPNFNFGAHAGWRNGR